MTWNRSRPAEADMPELPEVETIRRSLTPHIEGATVEDARFFREDVLETSTRDRVTADAAREFTAKAVITGLDRMGKYLFMELDRSRGWGVHFGMSGSLVRHGESTVPMKHTHVILQLQGGAELHYTCPRRFGRWVMCDGTDLRRAMATRLGVDALDPSLDAPTLQELLVGRGAAIKARLLQQNLVAGLGNIYVDEALFRAGIHPERKAVSLAAGEWNSLHESVRAVLREAIEHRGTTFSSYRDGDGRTGSNQYRLAVYGRRGRRCPRCGERVKRIEVCGRGTHFCPSCQE